MKLEHCDPNTTAAKLQRRKFNQPLVPFQHPSRRSHAWLLTWRLLFLVVYTQFGRTLQAWVGETAVFGLFYLFRL